MRVGGLCVRVGQNCLKYQGDGTEKRGGETKDFKMGTSWVRGWQP